VTRKRWQSWNKNLEGRDEPGREKTEKMKKIAALFLLTYGVFLVVQLFDESDVTHWDFRMYYQCAKASALGINPYDIAAVNQQLYPPIPFPYCYMPLSIWVFRLFALIPYDAALQIYLFLQCVMIAVIVFLWKQLLFGTQKARLDFFLFLLLAFNSAVYLCLVAGNVCIIEQLMIWLALFFFFKNRYVLFGILMIAGSLFKVQPILLLGLLLLTEDKERYKYFFGSCALFGALILAQYMVSPVQFAGFLSNSASIVAEKGINSPSIFTFFIELTHILSIVTGIAVLGQMSVSWILFLISAATVLYVSGRAFIDLRARAIEEKEKWIVYFALVVYALINVRLKDYSFMLAIVPTYFAITKSRNLKAFVPIFILVILSASHITLPGLNVIFFLLWSYYPLFLIFGIWAIYLFTFSQMDGEKGLSHV
jgi:hypothetical protein